MNLGCPNLNCSFYQKSDFIVKSGRFYRKDDSRFIQRYKCKHCYKQFSQATFSFAYKQKKRRVNHEVRYMLSSSMSMRRIAKNIHIARMTVTRKLIYLAKLARMKQEELLGSLRNQIEYMQFDDLLTIEHTKLKPLTVTLAVDGINRTILGAEVGSIPAFGHLSKMSRKKYGKRLNEHPQTITRLFDKIKDTIRMDASIKSDKHKFYPDKVKSYFPMATHTTYIGGRGFVAGQGELKRKYFDPLFTLNHSRAMLRANINRLVRKTWCTTKDPLRLKDHLDIFIEFYNNVLLKDAKKAV